MCIRDRLRLDGWEPVSLVEELGLDGWEPVSVVEEKEVETVFPMEQEVEKYLMKKEVETVGMGTRWKTGRRVDSLLLDLNGPSTAHGRFCTRKMTVLLLLLLLLLL